MWNQIFDELFKDGILKINIIIIIIIIIMVK